MEKGDLPYIYIICFHFASTNQSKLLTAKGLKLSFGSLCVCGGGEGGGGLYTIFSFPMCNQPDTVECGMYFYFSLPLRLFHLI